MRFNRQEMVKYWCDSSAEDYDTMMAMYESKRYNWTLFVGHLVIEKLLKALYVHKHSSHPPYIHNLLRLAEKCELELSDEQRIFFITVTAFNINARYDDYKMSFNKMCTPEYTEIWLKKLKPICYG